MQDGRQVGAALQHLDRHGAEPGAHEVAEALARFLVVRCDSHHAGWRVVRQVVVDSASDAPWEKCARRAVPLVAQDLIRLAEDGGRTPLARAQHMAAERRAEQIAVHVDQSTLLAALGLECSLATPTAGALRSAARFKPAHASRSLARSIAPCEPDQARSRRSAAPWRRPIRASAERGSSCLPCHRRDCQRKAHAGQLRGHVPQARGALHVLRRL